MKWRSSFTSLLSPFLSFDSAANVRKQGSIMGRPLESNFTAYWPAATGGLATEGREAVDCLGGSWESGIAVGASVGANCGELWAGA